MRQPEICQLRGWDSGRKSSFGTAIALGLGALVPAVYLWGYTVDDALVTARVAHQLANGHGYRFNTDGPVVDAVTPLGWVFLLVPFARSSALVALAAAKWMGAVSFVLATGWLGWQIGRFAKRRPLWILGATLLPQAPLAAWAVAGMETGVVTGLATLALAESPWALLASGWAAAWRPELLPWAATLAFVSGLWRSKRAGHAVLATVAVAIPSGLVMAIRWAVFGSVLPLSAAAKPSDLQHGLSYALAALIHTGLPALLVAPWAMARVGGRFAAIASAFAAHLLALVLVGGDWMALFRLMVPVLPGLLLVGAALIEQAAVWASALRLASAVVISSRLMLAHGPRARQVGRERERIIRELSPLLSQARHVASLDVGWVGVATPGEVVDLAGVTDPAVAVLPGGHTSKRLPPHFLRIRKVEYLVVLLTRLVPLEQSWADQALRRKVEVTAVQQAREIGFTVSAVRPLGASGHYAVLRLATTSHDR